MSKIKDSNETFLVIFKQCDFLRVKTWIFTGSKLLLMTFLVEISKSRIEKMATFLFTWGEVFFRTRLYFLKMAKFWDKNLN